jgi:succinoglycan biosynthesis transport protein ExoP
MSESSVRIAERAGHDPFGWGDAPLGLRHYINVLWRRRIAVFFTVMGIIVAGGVYTYAQMPLYQSTAKVLLQPSVTETILSADSPTSQRGTSDRNRVQTEIEVMNSQLMQEAVQRELGQLPQVLIEQRGETDIVAITATSTVPEEAARIAQTYADTYINIRSEQMNANLLAAIEKVQAQVDPIKQQLVELDRPIAELNARIAAAVSEDTRNRLQAERDGLIRQTEGQRSLLQSREQSYAAQLDRLRLASSISQTSGAQLVAKAEVPTAASSPRPMRNFVVTLGLSMLFGIVVAFIREHYDDTIKEKEDLRRVSQNIPVLGLIPTIQGWKKPDTAMLVAKTQPTSPPAEAYRTLRTSLQFMGQEHSVGLVQVTSFNQREGRTATVCNLAIALARAGQRVIVVDGDLRRPRVHEFFDLPHDVGLTSVLAAEVTLADAVLRVADEPRLAVLPSGPPVPDPSEVLSSQRCVEILAVLAAEADFVLVDGPPVLPFTDAVILARLVDAVIMVVNANATTRDSASRAIELLAQVNAPLIGSVLNRSR